MTSRRLRVSLKIASNALLMVFLFLFCYQVNENFFQTRLNAFKREQWEMQALQMGYHLIERHLIIKSAGDRRYAVFSLNAKTRTPIGVGFPQQALYFNLVMLL